MRSEERAVSAQTIRHFTDLHAWQEARLLAAKTYEKTKSFPPVEQFGLTNQTRRASVSIAANIAEGFARRTSKDKRGFYQTALGSLSELESHFRIAEDLKFVSSAQLQALVEQMIRVGRLITGLLRSAADRS